MLLYKFQGQNPSNLKLENLQIIFSIFWGTTGITQEPFSHLRFRKVILNPLRGSGCIVTLVPTKF